MTICHANNGIKQLWRTNSLVKDVIEDLQAYVAFMWILKKKKCILKNNNFSTGRNKHTELSPRFGPWHTDNCKMRQQTRCSRNLHACLFDSCMKLAPVPTCMTVVYFGARLACQCWCQVHSPHRSRQKSASILSVLVRFITEGPPVRLSSVSLR